MKLNWIAFYYEAFFNDCEHHANSVIGAYLRFIYLYTKRLCVGLPNDESQLRRLSGCDSDAEWKSIYAAIFGDGESGFFKLQEDGLFHQKRAREEFLISTERTEKKVKGGKEGARRRWHTQ